MKKVLICGDRKWAFPQVIARRLWDVYEMENRRPIMVITGGAPGADTLGEEAAINFGLPSIVVKAQWKKYGKAAGPLRNRWMLDLEPMLVLAFHHDIENSKGTRDCISEAKRRGIPVELVTG